MLLSGKEIGSQLLERYQERVSRLPRRPGLAVILVGDNPASRTYVKMKEKACKQVGIHSPLFELDEEISQVDLLAKIKTLNNDPTIDGILVQLPLPSQISEKKVIEAIDPTKDVDGFHPVNMGKLLVGEESGFIPCTPLGIQTLLHEGSIPIEGKHVVIVGRSNIVGKPLAALLLQKKAHANATVTIAHSASKGLSQLTRQADILVAAIGHPKLITAEMVKEGAVVVDVGISRVDGTLVGDVDFNVVQPKCAAITPVPGGVGPMTVAMLIHNTLVSCERRCES